MKIRTRRSLGVAVGLAFLALSPASSLAGTKEIAAINQQLAIIVGPNSTIQNATDAQLSQAVLQAIASTSNVRLNPAIIAAEALKGAVTATNIGDQLSQDLIVTLNDSVKNQLGTFPKILANVEKFVGTASSSAATGTAPNAEQIPDFAANFIATKSETTRNDEAVLIARSATASTTAIGAIAGGRTQVADMDTDAERLFFANQAISVLGKASQQISQYVGASTVDVPAFAAALTGASTNAKYVVQIATGTMTARPAAGSDIMNALFANNDVNSPVFKATVKNATKIASSVSKVASSEEVSQIADQLGQRVGLTTKNTANKDIIVGIKQSNINAIAKGLVVGLATRPTLSDSSLSKVNRMDEIGEIGAYLLNSVKTLPVFTVNSTANQKAAPNLIISLMKTIIGASLSRYDDAAAAVNAKKAIIKDTTFQATIAEDLAGSIGLTIRFLQQALDPAIYSAVRAALLNATVGTKIAGSSKTTFVIDGQAPRTISKLVSDALTATVGDGETDLPTLDSKYRKYENGSNPVYAQGPYNDPLLGTITEPETDIRNH